MGTVTGGWRYKLMILLIVFLTMIYTVNGLFFGVETDTEGFVINDDGTTSYINDNIDTSGKEKGDDIIGTLMSIGGTLSFANIKNGYARILLNLIVLIVSLSLVYILYTFIKEWIPFT